MANACTEARIREARLIVAGPEQVLAELEKCSGDEQLEKSLLARSNPLIDIGLARYAREKEVVAALYRKSRAKPSDQLQDRYFRGLRIACLSNEVVKNLGSQFPEDVLGPEEFARLINEGEDEELTAILSNPNLDDNVLGALYKNGGLFASLPDERRRRLVLMSIHNPRLTTNNESPYGPDFGHMRIHTGIFALLSCAPTTLPWLNTLRQLLDQLDPGDLHSSNEAITPILDRWAQVPVPEAGRFEDGDFTALSVRDEFRCLVAAMYGRHYSQGNDDKFTFSILGSPDSPDVVLRCAYYGQAQLTEKEMKEGFARDQDIYLLAVLCNASVYRNRALRNLLENDQLNENLRYVYQRQCARIEKRRSSFASDWLNEDGAPESKELTILKHLEIIAGSMTKTSESVQRWIIWGFFVLGALLLYRGH